MTLRPYWLGRLRLRGGEASFVAAWRLYHWLAMAASGSAWRCASAYESLDFPRRSIRGRRRGLSRCSSGFTGSTCCSSPRFPDTAAGPSNASREVLSPTAHSGCVALSRGGQLTGTIPLRRYPADLIGTTRPCGFDALLAPSPRFGSIKERFVAGVAWVRAGHASQVPCKRCSATRRSTGPVATWLPTVQQRSWG